MTRRWTAEDGRWSLRDLANHFNQIVLEAALEEEGAQLLDGEVENTYRLLTDDDVGEADRTRARRRLERVGIEVEDLLDDFVSYQAIQTFSPNTRAPSTRPTTPTHWSARRRTSSGSGDVSIRSPKGNSNSSVTAAN